MDISQKQELLEYMSKFLFDIMTLKKNINVGQDSQDLINKKMMVIYQTMKHYAKIKKEILKEEFLFPLTLQESKNSKEESSPEPHSSSDSSSSSDESETDSEYEFSDTDQEGDNIVNKNMAMAIITLKRDRQDKIFLRINKKEISE